MIYSLDANIFGPNTQSHPEDFLKSAMTVYYQTGCRSAVLVSDVTDGIVRSFSGKIFHVRDIGEYPISLIFMTLSQAHIFSANHPTIRHFSLSLEDIAITDVFDGVCETKRVIATNFPVLQIDWRRSKVFSTSEFNNKDDFTSPGDYCVRIGNETIVNIENAIFRSVGQPLYRDGHSILLSAEPFGQWDSLDPIDLLPQIEIEQPVLYLLHPYSLNYNIFFHETILPVLEKENLPNNTLFFVNNDEFRIDALARLGVSRERILTPGKEHMRFRQVMIPIRRLNLKYIGEPLSRIYKILSQSLKNESGDYEFKPEVIYLDRRKANNAGANRFIINDQEVSDALIQKGATQVFMEDLNLVEKFRCLNNSRTIITTIGANLVNIGFIENVDRVVLIASPLWGAFLYYWIGFLKMRHPGITIDVFSGCIVEDNGLSDDPFNKPFRVDVQALLTMI